MMPSLSNRGTGVCQWRRNKKTTLIVSSYLDINNSPAVGDDIVQIMEHCKEKNYDLIVNMDSNAHSELWGNDSYNARGEEIENFIII